MTTIELKTMATQLRRDVLRMVHGCQSGHPGGSLGCADLITALYFKVMNHHSAFSMDGQGEDLFFLSNGHISPLLYAALARTNYFELNELSTFRRLNSRLQGHPTPHEGLPGVRIASGSLGQGLSVANGAAIAKKMNADTGLVYCLMGDGELDEGQVWEAAAFASHHKMDNLIAIVDFNGQQIDGPTQQVLNMNPIDKKFETFGWQVLAMDGNNMEDVLKTLETAKTLCGKAKPTCIVMKTEMGFGVDFMQGTHHWHGIAPNDEQLNKALLQLQPALVDY